MSPRPPRLDQACVEQGLAPSRERARALIMSGSVLVDGQVVTKAGAPVKPGAELSLKQPDHGFVSRGALKLEAALEAFAVDVRGVVALDVGASTGGFTDSLLKRGARHVVAVDVGYGQLAWSLRQDPRVTVIERFNARYLTSQTLREALPPGLWPELGVVDVSFISLTLILPPMAQVLGPERSIFALVKPQFEAGRGEVGKGGVVRDPDKRRRIVERVLAWATDQGFTVRGEVQSPIAGPRGNVEQIAWLQTPPAGFEAADDTNVAGRLKPPPEGPEAAHRTDSTQRAAAPPDQPDKE